MAHIDLRAQVRAQHEAAKAAHLAATQETTRMHLEADEAEARGEHYTADLFRRDAAEQQAAANRAWYTN